jgi:cell division protein ZapD
VILYEYPFNERIRTYLRLEQMLHRLSEMMGRESPYDHHFALVTLFEIMDVAARADLKSDILKDLERQKGLMNSYRGNPAIVESALDHVIAQLDAAYTALNQQHGKAGSELLDNDWLMSVRSRTVIPGGTCSFDLPAYHAWQHRPARRGHAAARAGQERPVPAAAAAGALVPARARGDGRAPGPGARDQRQPPDDLGAHDAP